MIHNSFSEDLIICIQFVIRRYVPDISIIFTNHMPVFFFSCKFVRYGEKHSRVF